MPIYEYECPHCGRRREVIQSHWEMMDAAFAPRCLGCPREVGGVMHYVMSKPAPHQIGGVEGKLRTAQKIRKRNADYHRSPRGQEDHRANIDAARKRGLPA